MCKKSFWMELCHDSIFNGGNQMCGRVAQIALAGFVLVSAVAWTARGQANVNESLETATLWVDVVNGNDNNPGTQSEPFQTIAKSVAVAEANNQQGIGTHVYINPGLYRENITLTDQPQRDTALPETYEAVTPHTVQITGADQYTNWTQYSGNPNIYSTPWTFNFGLCPPLLGGAPPEPDINLRREMAFIDGLPLQQVLLLDEMVEGTFYVDDAGQQFYIWPPSGTNLSVADVELGDRGQLWVIKNKNGVVLRGLTFQYSADCITRGAVEVDYGPNQNIEFDNDNFVWNNATGLHLFSPDAPTSILTNYTVENVLASHNGAVGINCFECTNGLWQNDTADFNNWRGEEAAYYTWGAGGINNYGDANDTFININTDWNLAVGIHWDTNFQNINVTNVNSRNNLYHGVFFERNTGPLNATGVISCNNANEALQADGAATPGGGITLRDSENVTLTNSLSYGNGDAEFKMLGIPGGISVWDWQTGTNIIVRSENFTNTNNIFVGTDPTQHVLRDSTLNGSDWTQFQSTLQSNLNTWWCAYNYNTPYLLPVPKINYPTDFSGWQAATLQDVDSSFTEPVGNPQSACPVTPDMPDFWMVSNYPSLKLDPSGHAMYTDTVIPLDGFNGTVNLTYGGVNEIPGLSATLTPTTIPNTSGSTVFSLAATTAIAPGTYQVTVLGNSGSTTRATTAFLEVPATSIRLSTASVNFPNQLVHKKSAPMTVAVYNIGQAPVKITSIRISSRVFEDTTTCPSSLGAGQSCTINVAFTPPTASTYSTTLKIADSDLTKRQIVTLTGTGTIKAGKLSLSSEDAEFDSQVYQTTSAAKIVTATNIGSVPVTFSEYSFSGSNPADFGDTTNCGQELNPGDSCQFNLTFTPQGLGKRSATFNIMDNTFQGSNTVQLDGKGITAVSVSPKTRYFGDVDVGKKSTPLTVTLTNNGATLAVSRIALGGLNPSSFRQTNTCSNSVPANGSCTISVIFAPQSTGTLRSTLKIEDSDPTSPQEVNVNGTGIN
jgi:hypothetical protein